MEWSSEAAEYFERVPAFVRKAARRSVESQAQDAGVAVIDLDFVQQARSRAMGKGKTSSKRHNRGEIDSRTSELTDVRAYLANISDDPLTQAFESKSAVHPGMGGEPVDKSIWPDVWKEALEVPRGERATVYIHVPFCANRCLYCGFYMNAASKANSVLYADALIKEIDLNSYGSDPIQAVYFGGGTPTALEAADLKRVLEHLCRRLPITNDSEITIETSVAGLTDDRIEACIEGGANRFSVGVQSFNTKVRRTMGRASSREESIEALLRAKSYGRATVALDLVYGFPYQSLEIWEDDIKTFLSLELDGVDLYQLNIFAGGPMDKAAAKGLIDRPATLIEQARMYEHGLELMQAAGYRRLSLSHWGRDNRERSLYNRLAIAGNNCLQFGCGAGGVLDNYALFNDGDLKSYISRVDAGEKPLGTVLQQHDLKPIFNQLTDGLDRGQINLSRIDAPGMNLAEIYQPLFEQWQRAGLLESRKGWFKLTTAGEFWQVNLAQALIDYLKLQEEK